MAILNNLYPPVVPDTMPAFLNNGPCPIGFSIPIYNSIEDINKNLVQISIVDLNKNISALSENLYPSGIKITNMQSIEGSYGYNYIVLINPSDLKNGFELNHFYKVQLRFTKKDVIKFEKITEENSWFENHLLDFSEWSKACVIKPISSPSLTLNNFSEVGQQTSEIMLSNPLIDVIGKITFESKEETEYLKSYNVKILDGETQEVLFNSDDIYPIAKNEFNYTLPYGLIDGNTYFLQLSYTTNNLYQNNKKFKFIVIEYYGTDTLNAAISTEPNPENGTIKIRITSTVGENFLGSFTIRRTSSESNFSFWEDIKTVSYTTGTQLNYEWQDRTIQSGVFYKYCVQKRNSNGIRGPIVRPQDSGGDEYVICDFEDMFLTTASQQLNIKFNPTLGDFKYNVTESQQITIGSKYPYVKRNADNYFRTFSIGGLISSFIDSSDWYIPSVKNASNDYESQVTGGELKNFTSKKEIYNNNADLYEQYNKDNNISDYNDYIYERKFREKVYDFLYKNDVKLFRSSTQGNILVKLMNISFQPMDGLSRRLYSFTATAVEIDQANLSNYDKYNINVIGDYLTQVEVSKQTFGVIQGTYTSNTNIFKLIENKYSDIVTQGYIAEVKCLKYLKIEIDSQPYPIYYNNRTQQLQPLNEDSIFSEQNLNSTALGYIVTINGKNYFIPSQMERKQISISNEGNYTTQIVHNGFFELDNVKITSLSFPKNVSVLLSYTAQIRQLENPNYLIKKFNYEDIVGQLYGTFDPEESLFSLIYMKYFENDDSYYKRLIDLIGIRAEGPPGAVLYVQDSNDQKNFNRHILENGFLRLRDDDATIFGLYFKGIHLIESKNSINFFEKNGFKVNGNEINWDNVEVYNNIDEIIQEKGETLKNGDVFRILKSGIETIDENGYPKIDLYNEEAQEKLKALFIVAEDLNDSVEDSNAGWIISVDDENAWPQGVHDLLLEQIKNDNSLKFIYYYGKLYPILKAEEISKKLTKADIRHIRDNEYISTDQSYETFQDLQNIALIPNGVYKINNKYYIYYHKQWYPFDNENHDVLCPVDGLIDYYCQTVKGTYDR